MLYPKDIEHKLGFDKLKESIQSYCQSTLGEFYVNHIRFSSDYALIQKMHLQTSDFKKMLEENHPFPSVHFWDVTPYFDQIKPEGSYLDATSFLQIKQSFKTICDCIDFLNKHQLEYPTLFNLTNSFEIDKNIYTEIHKIISEEGTINDTASAKLCDIRNSLAACHRKLRKDTETLLRKFKADGYLAEDSTPTLRNGRTVLPIQSEFKRKIKGFIHDESATGKTTFMEPTELLEQNNTIIEFEIEEKREIIFLLTQLTDYIRPHVSQLRKAYVFLGLIDFIRAKALFARDIQASIPQFTNQPIVSLVNAFHPLLLIQSKTNAKKIVPLTLSINSSQRIIIVSGPNAGGKSVCLKTVGLIQYMFQCGIPIPADESSVLGIYENLFIDIGDEQSLENDLSTYSAHLTNMNHFLNCANKKTLVLIDEFGTGTEPQLGAAIAEAILQQLNRAFISGIITTHYSNLKTFADKHPEIVNAAMGYDMEALTPLYQLEIGKPGSSFAFEIAKKIGLPASVIQASKSFLDANQVNFEKLAGELEIEKNKYAQLKQELITKEKQLEDKLITYQKLEEELQFDRKKLIADAKEKAKALLADTNQRIEATIRQIKEAQAEKNTTNNLRKDLKEFQEGLLQNSLPKEEAPRPTTMETQLKTGDLVKIIDSGAIGKILSVKGKEAEIEVGSLLSTVKMNRLEKISKKEFRSILGEAYASAPLKDNFSIYSKSINFSPVLDVRGKRGEESLIEVSQFIENALVLHVTDLKIIHGKGDGILRTLIRSHLSHYKHILSTTDEHADRGGAGVTLIKTK